jgi:hypothetical protein
MAFLGSAEEQKRGRTKQRLVGKYRIRGRSKDFRILGRGLAFVWLKVN